MNKSENFFRNGRMESGDFDIPLGYQPTQLDLMIMAFLAKDNAHLSARRTPINSEKGQNIHRPYAKPFHSHML